MTDPGPDAAPQAVLDFWLSEVGGKGWFRADPDVDAACAERFGSWVSAAIRGGLDHWLDPAAGPDGAPPHSPREGALALIILLDQLPRNIFRGDARAFDGDARARWAADRAIGRGDDLATPPPARFLFYMPFEHSEELADQDRAVALIAERAADDPEILRHAHAHRDLIVRFGRFPHRNIALGRESTAEEAAHLAGGGYAPGARPVADAAGSTGATHDRKPD